MPIIRAEIMAFVDLWNIHRIYKQPTRSNSISGQPKLNYFYSKNRTRGYSLSLPPQLFATMQKDVAEWGISFFFLIN